MSKVACKVLPGAADDQGVPRSADLATSQAIRLQALCPP
jgi:hypothetical protein